MNHLSKVYIFKISATVLFWSIPLLILPPHIFVDLGVLTSADDSMFLRLLGWAYLALCVNYAFGLQESLKENVVAGPIIVGLVSNGGACLWLLYFGASGAWTKYAFFVQFVGWSSVAATFFITLGLYLFGYKALTRTIAMD